MKFKLLIICGVFSLACSLNPNLGNSAASPNQPTANITPQTPGTDEKVKTNSTVTAQKPETKSSADNCPPVKREGKRQVKEQTFPFNFKPFNNMCFVTFGSVEEMLDEKDLPRGSTFHLYQNGKLVVDLPDAFDGRAACWVEGVAFKDLNADGFTDIIIAGSCLAAKDSYPANAIFVNNGKAFTTNAEANEKLADLEKLSVIEAFVKKNQKLFF